MAWATVPPFGEAAFQDLLAKPESSVQGPSQTQVMDKAGGNGRPGGVKKKKKKPLVLWGDTLSQCEAGPEQMEQNSWPWALDPPWILSS